MADGSDHTGNHGGAVARVAAPRPPRAAAQTISTRMVQLIARYTGRGPTQARTTLNTNLVVVVLRDVMTKAEQSLASADGNGDGIRSTRLVFQDMLREEAREIVEQAIGRKVESVLADIDPVNDTAVQVFILEEIPETGEVDVAEVAVDGAAPTR